MAGSEVVRTIRMPVKVVETRHQITMPTEEELAVIEAGLHDVVLDMPRNVVFLKRVPVRIVPTSDSITLPSEDELAVILAGMELDDA